MVALDNSMNEVKWEYFGTTGSDIAVSPSTSIFFCSIFSMDLIDTFSGDIWELNIDGGVYFGAYLTTIFPMHPTVDPCSTTSDTCNAINGRISCLGTPDYVSGCRSELGLFWEGLFSYLVTDYTKITYTNRVGKFGPGIYTFCDWRHRDQVIQSNSLKTSREIYWVERDNFANEYIRNLQFILDTTDTGQWLLRMVNVMDDEGGWITWDHGGGFNMMNDLLVPVNRDVFMCEDVELNLYSE